MAQIQMTEAVLELLADRFKALAEPARLRILHALREGERSVTELAEVTGLQQANLSRHLGVLHALGFVRRRKQKLFVYYALAGEDVFRLCDIMCDQLERDARRTASSLAGA